MLNIVILGGGFAGVKAGLIFKSRNLKDIKVTLVDRNSFHTFSPSLYELAAAEEPQRNVTIPFKEIFGNDIEFKQGNVEKIDVKNKKVLLDGGTVFIYDYLIFALGSDTADFGIPGIKEYSIPLKTLQNAVQIKNALKNAKKVVVGGGGFSGTEIACELSTHKSYMDITLIQGSHILLKEIGGSSSELAKKRLEKANVRLILGEHIKKASKESIESEKGKIFPYDVFIWTGGVKPNDLLGKIEVNDSLQLTDDKNIFAAGDVISPGMARRAITMGKISSENILRQIEGRPLSAYTYHNTGYLVPLGSHFATFAMGRFHISGIFAYILQQLILFKYLLEILPLFKAIKRFIRFEKDLNI
ncbi:MAG: FAD-dependent oxidoreductase [Candidatus Levybacteria bacterium]|nr:FAD-dependent oxidoreductase [Candidatus Levybacteria bacterium]